MELREYEVQNAKSCRNERQKACTAVKRRKVHAHAARGIRAAATGALARAAENLEPGHDHEREEEVGNTLYDAERHVVVIDASNAGIDRTDQQRKEGKSKTDKIGKSEDRTANERQYRI